MWKLLVGFVVFAVAALFVLKKTGGDIDMGGEKHGVETGHAASAPAAAAAASAAATASATTAMPAASAPASAASN